MHTGERLKAVRITKDLTIHDYQITIKKLNTVPE